MSQHLVECGTLLEPAKERKPKEKTTKMAIMVKLSPELAAVAGTNRCPRSKVSRLLWDYIKANKLQDPEDGRRVLCDAKMKAVMGVDSLSMFEMTVRHGRRVRRRNGSSST